MKINLTIDRLEGKIAVLKDEEGNEITWPKNKLPQNIKEKDVLTFTIVEDKKNKEEKNKLAKDILNEILSPN